MTKHFLLCVSPTPASLKPKSSSNPFLFGGSKLDSKLLQPVYCQNPAPDIGMTLDQYNALVAQSVGNIIWYWYPVWGNILGDFWTKIWFHAHSWAL